MNTIELSAKTIIPITKTRSGQEHDALSNRCGVEWPNRVELRPDTHVCHSGLLGYLSLVYAYHYSVILRPDDIWFMILAELAPVIAGSAVGHLHLFTTTPGTRHEIIVQTDDVTKIDPEVVVDRLKDCVPARVDDFLPNFSTTTPDARLARYIAFCDLVSPYYSYSTFLCGIPAIKIVGTDEDWTKVWEGLVNLQKLFSGPIHEFLDRATRTVLQMNMAALAGDSSFFKKMVKIEPCGSGSQYEMSGWILDFCFKTKQQTQLEGLPPHIACMSYKNLDTGRCFKLFTGLTESRIQGRFLVPRYGQYVVEVREKAKPEVARAVSDSVKMKLVSTPVHAQPQKLKGWTAEVTHLD